MTKRYSRNILAWICLRVPYSAETKASYASVRNQVCEELRECLTMLDNAVVVRSIKVAEPPTLIATQLKPRHFLHGTPFVEYLAVETTVEIEHGDAKVENNSAEGLIAHSAAWRLASALELMFLLSELAYPGYLEALETLCVSTEGNFVYPISEKRTYRHLAFLQDGDPSWPALHVLDLRSVVSWAARTNMLKGYSAETRIERALAAYSHLVGLSWLRSGEALFRAMQGLEAFYCDGVGDLRRQLSQKVQLWLGPWEENRNIVGHLYDLRSAFVHGSAPLVYWGRDGAAYQADKRDITEFDGAVKLATRLLIGTLQRCVRENIHEMSWSYSFKAS